MNDQGAHPIWASDDEEIKREYQTVCESRDLYLSWFQRAESEAERLQGALERISMLPCENLNGGECPDYWAIGLSKEACASCIAREALDQERKRIRGTPA